jgi:hypothetical protein
MIRSRLFRKTLRVLAVVAVVVVVAGAVAVWALAHGPVDRQSLLRSVERESGSAAGRLQAKSPGCVDDGAGGWQCVVVDSGASGTASYSVQSSGGSCWTAQLRSPVGEPMPRTVSGCVLLRD